MVSRNFIDIFKNIKIMSAPGSQERSVLPRGRILWGGGENLERRSPNRVFEDGWRQRTHPSRSGYTTAGLAMDLDIPARVLRLIAGQAQ